MRTIGTHFPCTVDMLADEVPAPAAPWSSGDRMVDRMVDMLADLVREPLCRKFQSSNVPLIISVLFQIFVIFENVFRNCFGPSFPTFFGSQSVNLLNVRVHIRMWHSTVNWCICWLMRYLLQRLSGAVVTEWWTCLQTRFASTSVRNFNLQMSL